MILESTGNTDIGLKLAGDSVDPDLCTGIILAFFHCSGKEQVFSDRLIMRVITGEIASAHSPSALSLEVSPIQLLFFSLVF